MFKFSYFKILTQYFFIKESLISKMLIIILALSAISNVIQLIVSLMGWDSDEKKIITKNLKKRYEKEKSEENLTEKEEIIE